MTNLRMIVATILVVCVGLGGCATKQTSLYQWQGYQGNVDAYFRTDKSSSVEQIQGMEEDLKKIKANGGAVPPGYYAHLGLLYGQQGNLDRFAENVQSEKQQFSEAEPFMNFLLRNFKK